MQSKKIPANIPSSASPVFLIKVLAIISSATNLRTVRWNISCFLVFLYNLDCIYMFKHGYESEQYYYSPSNFIFWFQNISIGTLSLSLGHTHSHTHWQTNKAPGTIGLAILVLQIVRRVSVMNGRLCSQFELIAVPPLSFGTLFISNVLWYDSKMDTTTQHAVV